MELLTSALHAVALRDDMELVDIADMVTDWRIKAEEKIISLFLLSIMTLEKMKSYRKIETNKFITQKDSQKRSI